MEAMTEDYVRTARAKGASQRRVLYRHALRNALIPIITLLGLSLPAIVGGALITETVFNFPGMGLLTTQAAINNDVPLLLGTTFVAALATVARLAASPTSSTRSSTRGCGMPSDRRSIAVDPSRSTPDAGRAGRRRGQRRSAAARLAARPRLRREPARHRRRW